MRHVLLGLALLVAVASASPPQNLDTASINGVTLIGRMRPGAWTEYRTRNGDRDVHFFLTHDDRPKPLVVFLRGSGCAPLFVVNDDGTSSETSIFQDIVEPRRERFHFALIENPGIEPLRFAAGMSLQEKKQAFARSEDDCGGVYRANQTKSARVSDVLAVLNALAGQTWIQRTFVVGHSEGSHVATGVLHERLVDAVALFSSAGPTQFFGFHVARGASRESLIRTFADMRMLEQASDDTAYLGEPAKRWKSYALDSTPLEDVRDSPVPLYVAHGGLENNLLAADLFVLEALRQQPRRPVRYVVVDRGDHAFTVDGQSRMLKLFDDFVNWADNPGRSTEALLFK